MSNLANNPYCVWFDSKMRTFKTLAKAESFARSHRGIIGEWSEAEGWWVECPAQHAGDATLILVEDDEYLDANGDNCGAPFGVKRDPIELWD